MPGFTVDLTRLGYEHPLPADHPLAAVAAWADHLAAGRLGTPPAPPRDHPIHDTRCAGLAAILAAPRAGARA